MNKKFILFLMISMLLLVACFQVPLGYNALSQPNLGNTQPAATLPNYIPITGATQLPTDTETFTSVPTSTFTPGITPSTNTPTSVPIVFATPLPLIVPTSSPVVNSSACNRVGSIEDVTFPDGSIIGPGNTFTKTWSMTNLGSCTWTGSYAMVFSNGDLMGAPTVVSLPGNVAPGGTIDMSVNLVAPSSSGTYQGNWKLRDQNGNLFGFGSNADQAFWVRIVVGNNANFAVTQVNVSANPSSYNGICPVNFTFSADIWTNNSGTVTYFWQRSDGSRSSENTLNYSGSGRQTVSETLSLGIPGATYNGWDQIYIDQPNHQYFSTVNYNLTCAPATPTFTPTPTSTVPTATPTFTPTPSATPTSTLSPTPTSTPTRTPTPTLPPTSTPTRTPLPTNTPTPTRTPTPTVH